MTRNRLRGFISLLIGIGFIIAHFVEQAQNNASPIHHVQTESIFFGVLLIVFGLIRIARG
ncbi:MAG TPA: hypothetical protein VFJ58_03170 [Armatimonadota bacterium]|nr:hypothetical protein [Armatimonadota bacterium]